MKTSKEIILLPALKPTQVVEQVIKQIELERTGKQLGLLTRFPSLNIAFRKYFRFNQVNLFAGLSGCGKSLFVNILSEDFLDYKDGINRNIEFTPILLHFCFEMSAVNEMLRSIATDLGISFDHLLSSERITKEDGTKDYNVISNTELDVIKKVLEKQANKTILYFETSGNVLDIEKTVNAYYSHYKAYEKQENEKYEKVGNPKRIHYKFIVNFDHTLLVEKFNESTQLDIISNIAKMSIRLRKKGDAMINLIGQLNNNIEDIRRLTNPALHYPLKSDIYAQGELYNACDTVAIMHRPELLKITQYGVRNLPTKGLIHLLILKARFATTGSIWFEEDFAHGRLLGIEDMKEFIAGREKEIISFREET